MIVCSTVQVDPDDRGSSRQSPDLQLFMHRGAATAFAQALHPAFVVYAHSDEGAEQYCPDARKFVPRKTNEGEWSGVPNAAGWIGPIRCDRVWWSVVERGQYAVRTNMAGTFDVLTACPNCPPLSEFEQVAAVALLAHFVKRKRV